MHRLRKRAMRAHNPVRVLRAYMLQVAAERAAAGDFSETTRLLHLMAHPFRSDLEIDLAFEYDRKSSSAAPKPCVATLRWLNFRVLPPGETLTLHLPGFAVLGSGGEGADIGQGLVGDGLEDDRRHALHTLGATAEAGLAASVSSVCVSVSLCFCVCVSVFLCFRACRLSASRCPCVLVTVSRRAPHGKLRTYTPTHTRTHPHTHAHTHTRARARTHTHHVSTRFLVSGKDAWLPQGKAF